AHSSGEARHESAFELALQIHYQIVFLSAEGFEERARLSPAGLRSKITAPTPKRDGKDPIYMMMPGGNLREGLVNCPIKANRRICLSSIAERRHGVHDVPHRGKPDNQNTHCLSPRRTASLFKRSALGLSFFSVASVVYL